MDTTPPSVSNSVKLTDLNNVPAYNGFISLQNAEPSLGLPTGNTLTETNSAYYFPVFGITNDYTNSRKFTGNDSLVLKNKNLGINNVNPIFNVDIGGTVRATTGQITTLSTTNIVPPAGVSSLNITYPSGVNINSNVNVTGTVFTTNLTANNITTTSISAASATFVNTTTLLFTLTGAQIIGQNVTIVGSVTASNAIALTGVFTNTLSTNNIFTNSLTANTIVINNSLSAKNDIYASNIYGKVNINPLSVLYYNEAKQLTYNRNATLTFVVRPSDPYSTDDLNVARTTTGAYSATNYSVELGALKPFFKNIQPVLEYVKSNNLFGEYLDIWIQDDIVSGEQRPNGGTTLTDNSGNYSGLRTISGNLTAAFYSTEWLGANCPTLTAAGIKGGNFVWPLDPSQPPSGVFDNIVFQNINFKNIRLFGCSEIGSKIFADGSRYYSTWKPFNTPPPNITFRTYVCSNSALSFKDFGTKAVTDWTTVKTQLYAFNRPFVVRQDINQFVQAFNLAFEFDTNAYDASCLLVETGFTYFANTTVAMYGTGMYAYGALAAISKNASINCAPTQQLDPYYLTVTNWANRLNNSTFAAYDNKIFPGWGLAIVGNPPTKSPTCVYYGTTPYTGLIRIADGGLFNYLDYGTTRTVGRSSFLNCSIILDGTFNTPAFYYGDNGSFVRPACYLFSTTNFAVSSRNIRVNNTGTNPTYKMEFFDEPDASGLKINLQAIKFYGSFTAFNPYCPGLFNWSFSPTETITSNNGTPFLSYNNSATTPEYIYTSTNTVNITGSLITLGKLNVANPHGNLMLEGGRSLIVTAPGDIIKYNTLGYYKLNSPNPGNVQYTLNYYTSSTR